MHKFTILSRTNSQKEADSKIIIDFQKVIIVLLIVFVSPFYSSITAQVKNPILPGFYPDPSICRVENDYYLVNSSFSFFPGVPIFHSTDLVHWKQIGHVLDRPSQLKLTNQKVSAGIYAPTIRYWNGTYYMVTTLMGGNDGGNFFVTAKNPAGPWSEPKWLKEVEGIDPSFFFDDDGKAYLINNGPAPDNKPLYAGHRALWLQEFDLTTQKLIGDRKIIINGGVDFTKKPIWIEGPHIFKNKGYYYLLAAEGGTKVEHSEVIFRSKDIWGPYEAAPINPILTQRNLPTDRKNPFTSAGHADMVQTQKGDWVSIFLACEPYSEDFYNTGRQTFFNPVDWSSDWPVILESGLPIPVNTKSPLKAEKGMVSFSDYSANWKDDFDTAELQMEWNFIRTPQQKWYALKDNSLLIQARPIRISEVGNPSFIGRRLQFANSEFTTSLQLEKGKEMEAGIVAFQNENFYYKLVIQQIEGKNFLILSSASNEFEKVALKGYSPGHKVYLRMKALEAEFICEYSMDNISWTKFGKTLDGKHLSTAISRGFIGAYFGLYAYANTPAIATFDWATHKKLESQK
ncbi:MAG: glycoside hydrolase family 43 protein [Flavobacterium sp.]|nr:glycoside hydrolase family 43 protein [Flavobacterium sp.]